jgi:hypothetical protein
MFSAIGCPQMSWFIMEATNSKTKQRVTRLCQGYINEKLADSDKIRLPPKLYAQFKNAADSKISIQPLKHDVLNTLNRNLNDFRGAEILVVA